MIGKRLSYLVLSLVLGAPAAAGADEKFEAEQAFAHLLFGNYFRDPCANTTSGASTCPPLFSEKRMDYQDDKAKQAYVFENSPCIIHAETSIVATGKIYQAVFNLQNILYVNLNSARQEGSLMEVEFFLQGRGVIESNGAAGNVLVFIHKYYATDKGDIGHDIKAEVAMMRKAVKAYQDRFCPSMG